MKYVKMLGLAVVAAAALMAFVGAGTASAAGVNLCEATETPCTKEYPNNFTLHFSQVPGTSAKLTTTDGKTTLDTCTGSTFKIQGEVNTSPPTGTIEEQTWETAATTCTFRTNTISNPIGKIDISHIAGTDDGTVTSDTGSEIRVTINTVLFGSCVYGVTESTVIGTLTGGSPAHFDAKAVAKKLSGSEAACPETSLWNGEYVATTPSGGLYVET